MQAYGAFPEAGKRASADLPRRRRKYRTSYGHGISRVPRKATWKRGTQFGWSGAVAPGTVSGRRAHPPKAEKNIIKSLNIKERRKALRAALTLSINANAVKARGHSFTDLPSVVENKFESLTKTKDVEKAMKALGLTKELSRVEGRKIRAGKGKMRGRKYKTKKGPLLVVAEDCKLLQAGINIAGVEVCMVNKLNVNLLAPGGIPGRLTLYSEKAIEKIKADELFMPLIRKKVSTKQKKEAKVTPLKAKKLKKIAKTKTKPKKVKKEAPQKEAKKVKE
jgi:large subunit ribosomal protein L4e